MHPENKTEALLEKLTEYQLEIKSLKAEIEQLKKEKVRDEKVQNLTDIFDKRYKQSQVKFRTVFEQSKMGNKILAPDLTIIEVNSSLLDMLGYANKQDLLNRRILEFAHPDFIDGWQELQKTLWQNNISSFSIDTCLLKKDKSPVWCRVTSILFEDEGEQLGYTILEDISERKRLEEKAQKLYDAQEMIMHLVAHDLKNPLYVISTLAKLIKDSVEKGELEKTLEYITMLKQTCTKSHGIIDDLILIGEMENGVLEKEQIFLNDLIQRLIHEVSTLAGEKDIKIVLEPPKGKVAAIVNEEKFSRVLDNLLSNAIKFSHRGGIIKIVLEEEEGSCLIKVEDKGIGIPLNLQPFLFDRFTKAKRKGTAGEETTGLGLYISKRIVELHDGKIWLESSPNEGATFLISLPYKG